jgi:hypothetical protein
MKKYFLILTSVILFSGQLMAQGDGPRTFLLAPKDFGA